MWKVVNLLLSLIFMFLAGCGDVYIDNTSSNEQIVVQEKYVDGVYFYLEERRMDEESTEIHLYLQNENDFIVFVEIELFGQQDSSFSLLPWQEYEMNTSTRADYLYLTIEGYEYQISF